MLSVGNDVGRPHLQDMANAGAGLPLDGSQGNAQFYEANDPNQLKLQMRGIIKSAQSCIFRVLGGVVDPGILHHATVTVDGMPVEYQDPHGWVYHQDRKKCHGAKQCIELVGSACLMLQDGTNHTVQGDFLCVYYDPDTSGGGGSGGDGGSTGGGTGGPGMCINANGSCQYDGDCCSGICGGGTCIVN